MQKIEQGNIVRIARGKTPFLVISSGFFNLSGLAIVCPVVPSASADALHVPVHTDRTAGVALCEELATISLQSRSCSRIDRLPAADLLEIIYRVQSIFDIFPHAE